MAHAQRHLLLLAFVAIGTGCHAFSPVNPLVAVGARVSSMMPISRAGLSKIGTAAGSSPSVLRRRRSPGATGERMAMSGILAMIPATLARSSIVGGCLAGGLHAVSGPDHFPALLPRCVGKQWLAAGKIGALWGLGHAISAMAMGMMAFMVKDKAFASGHFVSRIAFGADIAIGLSLILIGFLSLVESKNVDFSRQVLEARSVEKQTLAMKANVLINGVFHGLALDGIPTLMPVLGLGSVNAACTFLLSYGIGVIGAMAAATVFIGQGTMSLAMTNKFDLSKIVKGSAFAAIFIGIAWTARVFIG